MEAVTEAGEIIRFGKDEERTRPPRLGTGLLALVLVQHEPSACDPGRFIRRGLSPVQLGKLLGNPDHRQFEFALIDTGLDGQLGQ